MLLINGTIIVLQISINDIFIELENPNVWILLRSANKEDTVGQISTQYVTYLSFKHISIVAIHIKCWADISGINVIKLNRKRNSNIPNPWKSNLQ